MTTNDIAAAALDAVRAANRPDADAELKRRIRAALDLGHSEVRVAEAAGISRVTLRAWAKRAWVVDWRGEEIVVEGRTFYPREIAQTLTDLPIDTVGFDGPRAVDLAPGESTWLVADISERKPRHLRWRVTAR